MMKHVEYMDKLKELLPSAKYYALLELQDISNIKIDVMKRIARALIDNDEIYKVFLVYLNLKHSYIPSYFNKEEQNEKI